MAIRQGRSAGEFLTVELAPLSRCARALTGDRDLAHAVLADALVRAQLHWSRIGSVERPAAYVRAMVTNGFIPQAGLELAYRAGRVQRGVTRAVHTGRRRFC